MPSPIDFWFDFSSPYGYIASELIGDVAARHGRAINWRPILLGPIFKAVGTSPLTLLPIKGEYSKHDFARMARFHKVSFRLPEKFPVGTQVATRAFYLIDDDDAARARDFAHRVYRAYFAEGADVADPALVMKLADDAGADCPALAEALKGEAIKERVKALVDHAMKSGVFGSPHFVVDGEPFWGVDRIPVMEEWIRTGGW
ncbi:MAG TPA: 2-hydroxychromene-2-carboxylate isomerase [Usitatibacteraceae bacterium]|nr:2-hydroxychromene-2-carboxylate isomerase [Usitatibacteraceae bacterium]